MQASSLHQSTAACVQRAASRLPCRSFRCLFLCDRLSPSPPQVHTFDPTVDVNEMAKLSKSGGYFPHLLGLGSQRQSDANFTLGSGPLRTLQQLMAGLGHTGRTIDILKIDCEGCEMTLLTEQVFTPVRDGQLSVGQLQVAASPVHHCSAMNCCARGAPRAAQTQPLCTSWG
jgi:Methyltransferase domain